MPRIARGSIPYEGIELLLFYIAIDFKNLERIFGIDPNSIVWKTMTLPLCYTRMNSFSTLRHRAFLRL